MEYLTRDPIIDAYFNFRNANEKDVPVFSETVLRFAVKHILQFKNQREDDVLSMYKMLMTIMLHFNNSKTLDELEEIMVCYDRNELMTILNDTENIQERWKLFTVEEMMYFIRKNAFFILMSEWIRRYAKIYGKAAITDEILGDMTLSIHDHFNWPVKSVHQWKRSFESKFLRGNSKEFDDHDLFHIKESDLNLGKITSDLNDKLHPLINEDNLRDFVSSIKSLDPEAANQMQVFKRRRRAEPAIVQSLPQDKDQFAEQTIEMFMNADDYAENKSQSDLLTDDEIEYVLEVTDDDGDGEEVVCTKKRKVETDDESDEEVNAKKVTNLQNGANNTEASDETEHLTTNELINDEQATKYLSALQAYSVVNGLFEAIGLLDQVDSIFRRRFETNS